MVKFTLPWQFFTIHVFVRHNILKTCGFENEKRFMQFF